jgi:hypothetical protein
MDWSLIFLFSSLVASALVFCLYLYRYGLVRTAKPSKLTVLALLLIVSDGLTSLTILIGKAILTHGSLSAEREADDEAWEPQYVCKIEHPIMIYFFNLSFGWTILIALRFKTMGNQNQNHQDRDRYGEKEKQQMIKTPSYTPYWWIPIGAFISVLPMVICSIVGGDWTYTDVASPPDFVGDTYCIFSNQNVHSLVLNFLCFQIPAFLTVMINCRSFYLGYHALQLSPYSVLAREMRRAHMYIFVLIIVWVPCLIINFLGVFGAYGDGSIGQRVFLPICVFLQTGQGVYNTLIYVFGTTSVTNQLVYGTGLPRHKTTSALRSNHEHAIGSDLNTSLLTSNIDAADDDNHNNNDINNDSPTRDARSGVTASANMDIDYRFVRFNSKTESAPPELQKADIGDCLNAVVRVASQRPSKKLEVVVSDEALWKADGVSSTITSSRSRSRKGKIKTNRDGDEDNRSQSEHSVDILNDLTEIRGEREEFH